MPILADNKKVRHDYQILDKFEAGLVLEGAEVKSAKGGRINLHGAYVIPKQGELWITGLNIAAYPPAKGWQVAYDPIRDRKLLLKAKELGYLLGKQREKGLTVVPVSVYTRHGFIKLEIAVARGKTRYDKRDALRKRETKRELSRSLKK
ncbi:SsrA-binding protein SmpB [Patescibacteria group bacterium]|nr:SsrA-binding protein SmpB [Patescibacteria group bacterium]